MQKRYRFLWRGLFFVVITLFVLGQAEAISLESQKGSISEEFPAQGISSGFQQPLNFQSKEISITYAGSTLWQGTNFALGAGNYAYSFMYFGLRVVDVSNPASPTIVGEYHRMMQAEDAVLAGTYLYVAARDNGLLIFDISDPHTPSLSAEVSIGEYEYATELEIVEDYAYVCASRRIFVVDISQPYAPVVVNQIELQSQAMNISTTGHYAYITSGHGLEIWDISNPAAPVKKGTHDCGEDTYGVAVSGNFAYLAVRGSGLRVINILNPLYMYDVGAWRDTAVWYNQVELVDNYIYLGSYDTIRIIDITNPYSPAHVDDWPTMGFNTGLTLVGDRAYLADWTVGLSMYDISSPAAPTLEWTYETPGMGYDLAIAGDYAYEANGIKGLQVLDISNPEKPLVISSFDTPGSAQAIALQGNFVYIIDNTSGLMVINISDPYAPYFEGTFTPPTAITDIVVAGNYAYVTLDSLLQVIDVSNPQAPSTVGSIRTSGSGYQLAVQGNYAYVSCLASGMDIIDISDPAAPAPVGRYAINNYWGDITVSGKYAYLAIGGDDLNVINITDPQTPTLVGSYPISQLTRRMTVVGDYLYLSAYVHGFMVLNVSNPQSPYLAGFYNPSPGWTWAVAVAGENIYIAADNGFLSLWQDNCGGPNGTGRTDVSDVIFLISYIFRGGAAPEPLRTGDVNCDELANIGDAIYLINFIFGGGEAPCGGCY